MDDLEKESTGKKWCSLAMDAPAGRQLVWEKRRLVPVSQSPVLQAS